MLEAADKVEIRILVDNATDMLSSNPPFVESESGYLNRRGFKISAAKCLCCAVHGLSCLVTAHRGGKSRTVLFDTGPEDYAFERNVTRSRSILARSKASCCRTAIGIMRARCCSRSA